MKLEHGTRVQLVTTFEWQKRAPARGEQTRFQLIMRDAAFLDRGPVATVYQDYEEGWHLMRESRSPLALGAGEAARITAMQMAMASIGNE